MSICILAQFNLKCSQDLVLITKMDIKNSVGDHKSSSLNSKTLYIRLPIVSNRLLATCVRVLSYIKKKRSMKAA